MVQASQGLLLEVGSLVRKDCIARVERIRTRWCGSLFPGSSAVTDAFYSPCTHCVVLLGEKFSCLCCSSLCAWPGYASVSIVGSVLVNDGLGLQLDRSDIFLRRSRNVFFLGLLDGWQVGLHLLFQFCRQSFVDMSEKRLLLGSGACRPV